MGIVDRRDFMTFAACGLLAGAKAAAAPAKTIETDWLNLMKANNVPGMAVARIEHGRIKWVRGFGLARREGNVPVTAATRFQAASISKPVAALGALRLVEQGRLSLDAPVLPLLRSWRPSQPSKAWDKITLRMLVTHSAGLTVHGFPGYAANAPLPTLAQIIDGVPPANSEAVRPEYPSGIWRYSGGGIILMQMLMSDVTGKSFTALMKELVLDPLGMRDSSYLQPPTDDRNCAFAYRADGQPVEGHWHVYPEQAAAGLWTTPRDLARFAIALLPGQLPSDAPADLKKAAALILTPQLEAQGHAFGLGLMLNAPGKRFRFSHGGSNEGFQCLMAGFPDTGEGVAVMTNGDNGAKLAYAVATALTGETS